MFEIDKECLEPKRYLTTTKDEMYMLIAMAAATNSKDPATQVGSCYVGADGNLLSVGCNGAPNFWDEDEFPWGTKKEYGMKNLKYTYVIHAEMNGAHNYRGSLKDFEGGTLYMTLFPCTNCAKLISSLKIKKLVYLNAREDSDDFVCASILLQRSHVECVRFIDTVEKLKSVEFDTDGDEKSSIKIKKRSLTY